MIRERWVILFSWASKKKKNISLFGYVAFHATHNWLPIKSCKRNLPVVKIRMKQCFKATREQKTGTPWSNYLMHPTPPLHAKIVPFHQTDDSILNITYQKYHQQKKTFLPQAHHQWNPGNHQKTSILVWILLGIMMFTWNMRNLVIHNQVCSHYVLYKVSISTPGSYIQVFHFTVHFDLLVWPIH